MAPDLVRWASGGVLRDWTRRVRRHVLEDSTQPVDDVVIIDLTASPGCRELPAAAPSSS
jgi:hypothetical protein